MDNLEKSNIISFEEVKEKNNFNITEQDIFNIFLVYRHMAEDYFDINLDTLMESLGKYSKMERFQEIYKDINIITKENERPSVNLLEVFEKEKQEKRILEYPSEEHIFCIISPKEDLDTLKEQYNEDVYNLFDSLMFFASQDLEFGLDGWQLLFEDEYIDVPRYPGVVTGEFIGQKKDARVMKKVKKKAIENLKNMYQ